MLSDVIRELRDEDVGAVVRVLRAVHVDFVNTESSLRHSLAANSDDTRHRYWVAEEEGEIVGRARASFETFSSERHIGRVNVSVSPERRRRGLGAALYAVAQEHLVRAGARRLLATADDPAGRPFLQARGFRHTHTDVISAVEPAAADLAELPAPDAARAAEGLRLVPLASVRDLPRNVYELHIEALADVPTDTPFDDVGYEDWLRSDWSYPDISDDGSFVVLEGGRPVSIAFLVVDPVGRLATNAFTGTLRAYRGRGLARLVKLASIRWAAEQGVERILTGNDETNAAMLAVNRRLGYRPVKEHYSYVKEL
jgi:GNAT superfamily N-acetyltransferase